MSKYFYKVYHANLAFSAIPENEIEIVIDKTYLPLLELIKNTNTKIAIEMSAYTLEQIKFYRPQFIKTFKELYKDGLIELIASGYMQIIGPVIPYRVNIKNQKLGLKVYKEILGISPSIVFVNEQTFSSSMVDNYYEVGYKAIVMEWNNAYSFNHQWKRNYSYSPIILNGVKNKIPVLWSDSILFQQFQRVAHNENTFLKYKTFLEKYLKEDYNIVPIYSSDLEIFNYRPGRFETEARIEKNEWSRIYKIVNMLKDIGVFKLPSEILEEYLNKRICLKLTNSLSPIIVKKQTKYSLSRWMACGRGANYINTLCYRYYLKIKKSGNNKKWKKLLKYWGSDYRTHITIDKWKNAISFLEDKTEHVVEKEKKIVSYNTHLIKNREILHFRKGNIEILFNLNKGLCLDSIIKDKEKLLFGSIHHGELNYIQHGADYYTGTTTIESTESKKITDLEKVSTYSCNKISDDKYQISTKLKLKSGILEEKSWTINFNNNSIIFNSKLLIKDFINGSIRLGTFTLLPSFVEKDTYLKCKNGGKKFEKIYLYKNKLNQHISKSLLQSSSSGIGVSNGKLKFYRKNKKLFSIKVNRNISYPYIMLQNNKDNNGYLTRIHFSVQELDDTLKNNEIKEYNLEYKISF